MSRRNDSSMAEVKQFVDNKIASKKVIIFVKKFCPYCTEATGAFKKYLENGELSSADYEVVDIWRQNDCHKIQTYLRSITGAGTVPRVFINGKSIGGADQTFGLERSNLLGQLLKQNHYVQKIKGK